MEVGGRSSFIPGGPRDKHERRLFSRGPGGHIASPIASQEEARPNLPLSLYLEFSFEETHLAASGIINGVQVAVLPYRASPAQHLPGS